METVEEVLQHFGVRGMHWGVRRRKIASSSKSVKSRNGTLSEDAAKAHEAHKTVQTHRSTDPLSNKELQHLVNRINLEQQYVRLTTKQSVVKRGQNYAKDFLGLADTAKKIDDISGNHGSAKIGKEFAKFSARRAAKTSKHLLGG